MYNAIVMIINMRMKGVKLEPTNITISAMGATIIVRDWVYWEEGLPSKIYSNRGLQFISKFMKELYGLLSIKGNLSMAYCPQTDGQMEQTNHEVKKYLWMFININNWQTDWMDWLMAEFTYNNGIQEVTGQTPFFMNKGRHPWMHPMDLTSNQDTPTTKYLDAIQAAG
jgi:transposase InsO family protein